MIEIMRNTLKRKIRRLALRASPRRFMRRQDGAVAVEFALILLPFLALMFGIMETALVFFADQTLETAVADSARLIMTFKNAVCSRIYGLFNCQNGIYVNVQTYSSFGSITNTPPLDTNGNLVTSNFVYQPGGPGDIVVVRLYYQWPIYVSLMSLSQLSNMSNHNRLLVATAAFRNEPYN
jgi:Flp pilus assembly protein TadG